MVDSKSFSIGGVITIVVVALLAATMIPPAINAATGADFSTETEGFTLAEGETYNFTHVNTSATLDSVNASGSNQASYTFESGPDSATVTLSSGDNTSVSLDGKQYNVSVTDVNEANGEATASVEYKTSSGTAGTIWNMVPLFMVLAIALVFIGYSTQAKDGL